MFTRATTIRLTILIQAVISIVSCQAGKITVPATDPQVNQYPPEAWAWLSDCDQYIWTSETDNTNVSFTFMGDIFIGLRAFVCY
jgi:hypothetical protein